MNIYNFYNNIGWEKGNKNSKDAELFEDLRQCAKIYVSKCRKKINKFILLELKIIGNDYD